MPRLSKTKRLLLLLLAAALLLGIATFRDYGVTWDEPLYYAYADAIGYAYSIPARLSGDFQINRAYGPSAADHRNRGPAYLLLARNGVYLLHALTGIDKAALWHFINFLSFLIGVYFLYELGLRWLSPEGSLAASALFLTQPLLWGHAFINPKDIPFLSIFILNLYVGLRMVESLYGDSPSLRDILLPGVLLGLATNLRIIAPLIAALLFLYAFLLSYEQKNWKPLAYFLPYGIIAILTLYATWPYLWDAPIRKFIEVLTLMSHNPTTLKVLFLGRMYPSYDLPRRYLPWLMGLTLTEPVWILFGIGGFAALSKIWKKRVAWQTLLLIALWFLIPFVYVLLIRPPMYDGYRHFLFILPPIFLFSGFAFDALFRVLRKGWSRALLSACILLPGIFAAIPLHPYEYAYYNQLVGGTSGAFRTYETEYWLTCYKETIEEFNEIAPPDARLAVYREARNAAYYTREDILVEDYRAIHGDIQPGEFVLISSRSNEDERILRGAPTLLQVGREGATFCVIKEYMP